MFTFTPTYTGAQRPICTGIRLWVYVVYVVYVLRVGPTCKSLCYLYLTKSYMYF